MESPLHDDNAYEPEVVRVPLPPDFADERDIDVLARADAFCGAAEDILAKMIESGQIPAITEEERVRSRIAFDEGPASLEDSIPTGMAMHLAGLLNKYDMQVVQDASQIRNLCMNVMIEKAVKGKSEQVQLRAVEMLGKVKDVGLFEERSTVMIEHMSSDQIQDRLRDKINRLKHMATTAIDVTPTKDAIDNVINPPTES